jgi:glutamate-1-semialdehyde 2,1-aminomutase
MAAGARTLAMLRKPGLYEGLDSQARRLERGLVEVFAQAETPLRVNRVGSMMTLFFNPGDVDGWESVTGSDREGYARFFHRMLDEGVYLPPSPFEAMFVSTAHSEKDIDATIDAARRALA